MAIFLRRVGQHELTPYCICATWRVSKVRHSHPKTLFSRWGAHQHQDSTVLEGIPGFDLDIYITNDMSYSVLNLMQDCS